MPPVKILHVTSTPEGIGGVERLLLDMARHYDPSRVSVWHCNLFDRAQGSGRFPTALRETGLPYVESDGSRWRHLPKIVWKLLRAIRKEGFDIVHLHMVHATIIGGFILPFARPARVIVSKHYTYGVLRKPVLKALDVRATNRMDRVIGVSRYVEAEVRRHGAPPENTLVIHNGSDLVALDRRSAESPLTRAGGLLLGSVGNLHPRKGHEFAIRAMPEILQNFPAARLVIIGEGPERPRLEALVRSLGVGDAVSLMGFQENVPAVLKQLDVYVHPSVEEPFGIAILEAMAARKAVVASQVEGIPEIVVDGVTGILVPPREHGAIANAVCRLIGDASARKQMGIAGRERVEREFNIRRTTRAHEALYLSLSRRCSDSAARPQGGAER